MAAEALEAQIEQPPSPAASAPVAASAVAAQTAEQPVAAGSPEKGSKRSHSKSAKGAKSAGSGAAADVPSVAAHPRAARGVARAKGWGGLAGFLIAGYLSLPTGTVAEAALRALVAGTVCYVVAWAGAVFIWRRLVMIEIKGREQRLMASHPAFSQREPAAAVERSSARATS